MILRYRLLKIESGREDAVFGFANSTRILGRVIIYNGSATTTYGLSSSFSGYHSLARVPAQIIIAVPKSLIDYWDLIYYIKLILL